MLRRVRVRRVTKCLRRLRAISLHERNTRRSRSGSSEGEKKKPPAALPARHSRVAGQVEIRAARHLPRSSRERRDWCGLKLQRGRGGIALCPRESRNSAAVRECVCVCISSQRCQRMGLKTLSFSERAPIYLHFRLPGPLERQVCDAAERENISHLESERTKKRKEKKKKLWAVIQANVIVMTPNDLKPLFLNHLQPSPYWVHIMGN